MSIKNASKFKIFTNKKKSRSHTNTYIPFFPKYETHQLYKERLRVTWFESDFSQSKYNFENNKNGSNACTLIAILTAAECSDNHVLIEGPDKPIDCKLIYALASGMVLGNAFHETLKEKKALVNYNLTVPEAIRYGGKHASRIREWKSLLFSQPLVLTLYENLKKIWREWHCYCTMKSKRRNLYVILISDSRSVLFIFQDRFDTVTLIDSHQHTQEQGAFIATVDRISLKVLCKWFGELIYQCYESYPQLYELAMLYFRSKKKSKKSILKHVTPALI